MDGDCQRPVSAAAVKEENSSDVDSSPPSGRHTHHASSSSYDDDDDDVEDTTDLSSEGFEHNDPSWACFQRAAAPDQPHCIAGCSHPASQLPTHQRHPCPQPRHQQPQQRRPREHSAAAGEGSEAWQPGGLLQPGRECTPPAQTPRSPDWEDGASTDSSRPSSSVLVSSRQNSSRLNRLSPSDSAGSTGSLCQGRAKREFVPDSRKDETYWSRRQRNNESARLSRLKRKKLERDMEVRLAQLQEENVRLKLELRALKQRFSIESVLDMSLPSSETGSPLSSLSSGIATCSSSSSQAGGSEHSACSSPVLPRDDGDKTSVGAGSVPQLGQSPKKKLKRYRKAEFHLELVQDKHAKETERRKTEAESLDSRDKRSLPVPQGAVSSRSPSSSRLSLSPYEQLPVSPQSGPSSPYLLPPTASSCEAQRQLPCEAQRQLPCSSFDDDLARLRTPPKAHNHQPNWYFSPQVRAGLPILEADCLPVAHSGPASTSSSPSGLVLAGPSEPCRGLSLYGNNDAFSGRQSSQACGSSAGSSELDHASPNKYGTGDDDVTSERMRSCGTNTSKEDEVLLRMPPKFRLKRSPTSFSAGFSMSVAGASSTPHQDCYHVSTPHHD